MQKEFASQEPLWMDPVTRRSFLKVMGASLGAVGSYSMRCAQASRARAALREQPEDVVLGKSLYFATAMVYRRLCVSVLVEKPRRASDEDEGNPDHPATLGAASAWMQASILSMYDPDRSQVVRKSALSTSGPCFSRSRVWRWASSTTSTVPG